MTDPSSAGGEHVRVEVGDRGRGIATVTIDRPDARNALNAQVREEMHDVIDAIEASDVRVVVVTGAEEAKAFVAGADVTEFRDRDALDQREASARPRVYDRIAALDRPVIARINGHALGGGCELALACDVRLAFAKAKLGQPEINLGIMPGGGATQRLPRLVGEGQAMRLILSGELVDAEEAQEIGLVEEVYDDLAALDERVDGLAGAMAAKSRLAVRLSKEAISASARMSLPDGIDYEAELFAHLFATADKDEGIDAFLEGREPEWSDR